MRLVRCDVCGKDFNELYPMLYLEMGEQSHDTCIGEKVEEITYIRKDICRPCYDKIKNIVTKKS